MSHPKQLLSAPLMLSAPNGERPFTVVVEARRRLLTAPEVEYIVRDCGAKVMIASAATRDVATALGPRFGPLSASTRARIESASEAVEFLLLGHPVFAAGA